MIRVLSTLDRAATRLGYAWPRAREGAPPELFLLLDSMEAGLAHASMSMAGCGRLAALMRVDGPELDRDALAAAVATLRERHGLLRRTLRRTRFGLALGPCDVDSSVTVITADGDEGWREAWREIEALPLLEGTPLVSVYAIKHRANPRRADLLLVIEHIISDGASLVSLAKEILELVAPGASAEVTASPRVQSFPPTVITMAKDRVGGTVRGIARLGRAMARTAARDFENPHVRLPRANGPRFGDCHTHVAFRDVDAAFYDALFVRARREKVSVAATIIAALSLAMAEREHRAHGARGAYHVMPHVTVDLRGRYAKRVANGDLGVHISTVDPCITIAAEDLDGPHEAVLFDLARTVRAEMQELLRAGVDRHFLSSLAAGVGMLLPRMFPEQSLGSFIFTDAAAFAVPTRLGRFSVISAAALANCRAQSLPYVVTTRSAEQMRISMMVPTPAFAAADVEVILDATVARLARAIGVAPDRSQQPGAHPFVAEGVDAVGNDA